MIRISIDGRIGEFEAGTTVLAAARELGIDVPTLCDDPRFAPSGACRLCLVETGGHRPVPACATPIEPGMTVQTSSPSLIEFRRTVLEFLAHEYPATAVATSPHRRFHELIRTFGIGAGDASPAGPADVSHPYLKVDLSKCINCERCVRICRELEGQDVWHFRDRGANREVQLDAENLARSTCVACGACADTCPTGAIADACAPEDLSDVTWTRTVCPYCGVGCELDYGTREDRIVATRPVLDAPVNRGHACIKGRYAFDFVDAGDRVIVPRRRDEVGWRDVTWSDAIGSIANRLRAIIDRDGPDAVGVLGSARATNEENYLIQKCARVAIGTNNVDCCARVCHAPSAKALKRMLGAGAATNSFDDIEEAATILVCGANPTENHPVVGSRIRQAVRRGAALIVIDPRGIELAHEPGTLHLAVRPGTNIPVLYAFAQVILAEGLADEAFVARHVDNLAAFGRFVQEWTPERAAGISGVPADRIRQAARTYATRGPAMIVHGLGVTEHRQGTDGVEALVNLALLCGHFGKRGTGVNPLRGQNNVQGAAHMGCEPGTLTGGLSIDLGRQRFEAVWGRPVPSTRGLTLPEMIDAALEGRLKALIVVGYDILLTNPNEARTRRALERLDLLVVQDLFLTETAKLAHVFLPVQSSFEKDGTFMNAERRVQRVRRVITPRGDARSDLDVIRELAGALGHAREFGQGNAEAVWNEIRQVWPAADGMTYARLNDRGLQWPCPRADHPGTSILYGDGFPAGHVSLSMNGWRSPFDDVSDEFPFILTTGRTLCQFNAGTMTSRTPNQLLRPFDTLDVAPADAAALRLHDGDRVRIVSRFGTAILPVRISRAVGAGTLFATFHTAEAFLNRVTSDVADPVGTPEYKVTAVKLEPLALASLTSS